MGLSITAASSDELRLWRERHRAETTHPNIQDRFHDREAWTRSFTLRDDNTAVGYGSLLVGHLWKDQRLIFQFYLAPSHRARSPEFFAALSSGAKATGIRAQTNDALLAPFLTRQGEFEIEKILFLDQTVTTFPPPNCRFRPLSDEETGSVFTHEREPVGAWALERDGRIVATGGAGSASHDSVYAELHYEVFGPVRRQGLGTYLIQEIKSLCHRRGAIPCARCDPDNVASRRTLLRAGFVICGDLRTEKFGG
jgi:RimJ/RimL family protein N-acetyltransferase